MQFEGSPSQEGPPLSPAPGLDEQRAGQLQRGLGAPSLGSKSPGLMISRLVSRLKREESRRADLGELQAVLRPGSSSRPWPSRLTVVESCKETSGQIKDLTAV